MEMGRGEQRVRCMERVTWKLTLPYNIDSQWEFAVWLRKLKQGLCINLERWDGEGDRRDTWDHTRICMHNAANDPSCRM